MHVNDCFIQLNLFKIKYIHEAVFNCPGNNLIMENRSIGILKCKFKIAMKNMTLLQFTRPVAREKLDEASVVH